MSLSIAHNKFQAKITKNWACHVPRRCNFLLYFSYIDKKYPGNYLSEVFFVMGRDSVRLLLPLAASFCLTLEDLLNLQFLPILEMQHLL